MSVIVSCLRRERSVAQGKKSSASGQHEEDADVLDTESASEIDGGRKKEIEEIVLRR